ncbi:hypothetical protein PVAG01_11101 [Phlyctema vagabunda]|uniref:T6SS Phospholipase effector Tle1-like catalytic domain-containing protein n=1 Tax=Phlyctema vagabunda TaxID=108571 RepID=A0ABR4P1D0_9HELO
MVSATDSNSDIGGSWQSADKNPQSAVPSFPTNIVRLNRSIKPTTWVDKVNHEGKTVRTQVDQITYYQSGVGTGLGDILSGGAIGMGLSQKIRAVYGFLANNYVEGDTIAIFGFSRGAYTARAIGGLITNMGLLSKRGMDNFKEVYGKFYNRKPVFDHEYDEFGLFKIPPGTIEVIGVFDTVGFHNPIATFLPAWLRQRSLLKRFVGEQYEMENTELPDGVKYAFHALSLDEARFAFRPTLWFQHKDKVKSHPHKTEGVWDGKTLLEQVWFSGTHSHVGGGLNHQELSAIAFGWMASQLTKYGLLDLDPDYLLNDSFQGDSKDKWATKNKLSAVWMDTTTGIPFIDRLELVAYNILYWFLAIFAINKLTSRFESLGGVRTPGRYIAKPANSRIKPELFVTNEYLHSSINDRNIKSQVTTSSWPCVALRGWKRGNDQKSWTGAEQILSEPIKMKQTKIGDVEKRCKNNLRDLLENSKINKSFYIKSKVSEFTENVEDNEIAENTLVKRYYGF